MSETPRKWNSSKVLKVNGTFVRQGVFTGHTPDEIVDGRPARKPSAFTPTVLQKIMDNFHGEVPYYIDHHYGGGSRKEIGKAFKVGISSMKDSVAHEGFVWDPLGQRKIKEEGYSMTSPEFDIQYDDQGNIVNAKLTGIVYVINPAISGTDTAATAVCFSEVPSENTMTGEQDNQTPPATPPVPPVAPIVPPVTPPVQKPQAPPQVEDHPVQKKIQYVTDPALVAQLNQLGEQLKSQSAKLAQYDTVVPGLIAQNEQMKTQQMGTIANALKDFGIENPESLVEGLPIDGKIAALAQLRDRLVKSAPMTKAPDDLHARATRAEANKATFTQVLTELGLTEESYNRIMNGGKIV